MTRSTLPGNSIVPLANILRGRVLRIGRCTAGVIGAFRSIIWTCLFKFVGHRNPDRNGQHGRLTRESGASHVTGVET